MSLAWSTHVLSRTRSKSGELSRPLGSAVDGRDDASLFASSTGPTASPTTAGVLGEPPEAVVVATANVLEYSTAPMKAAREASETLALKAAQIVLQEKLQKAKKVNLVIFSLN